MAIEDFDFIKTESGDSEYGVSSSDGSRDYHANSGVVKVLVKESIIDSLNINESKLVDMRALVKIDGENSLHGIALLARTGIVIPNVDSYYTTSGLFGYHCGIYSYTNATYWTCKTGGFNRSSTSNNVTTSSSWNNYWINMRMTVTPIYSSNGSQTGDTIRIYQGTDQQIEPSSWTLRKTITLSSTQYIAPTQQRTYSGDFVDTANRYGFMTLKSRIKHFKINGATFYTEND